MKSADGQISIYSSAEWLFGASVCGWTGGAYNDHSSRIVGEQLSGTDIDAPVELWLVISIDLTNNVW
jgi:hypothetical protein